MIYLLTFLWALPSGLIWLINAEAMVVYQVGTDPDATPWLIALAATAGQFIGYGGLYHFASLMLTRFAFVRRSVAKVKIKDAGLGTYTMFTTGGLMGFPPLLGLFTLYGSKKIGPLQGFLLCAVPMRFLWYCSWAYAAEFMRHNFSFFSQG